MIERGEFFELHLGDWRDADLPRVDAVIEDPPYGKRTHTGVRVNARSDGNAVLEDLGYAHIDSDDVVQMCEAVERTPGWTCSMTSHDLVAHYEAALIAAGRYVFAPIPIVTPGMNVRLGGDGPSNWTVYMVVSRERSGRKCWGTKPGAYTGFTDGDRRANPVKGSKPLSLMEAIVRDYTDPGDLVLDRFTGSGTTGVAAIRLGRRFVGWERKPEHFEIALARLRAAAPQRDMWEASPAGTQEPLL